MNDDEAMRRGTAARAIIQSPLWDECWQMYRDRLLTIIDDADSSNTDLVMHAKRLLAASKAARMHMESIFADGKVAVETIKLDEQRKKRWGVI